MIGNLSKSIVKLPNFFLNTLDENNDIENEKTLLDNNLFSNSNNYYRPKRTFREKDFLRFAPLVENLNFNRNRKHFLFSKLNQHRKKCNFNDIVKTEEIYTSNLTTSNYNNNNNNNNNNNDNNNNNNNNENFSNKIDNNLTQTVKTEKFNYESKLVPIQKDEIEKFNNTVRTNIDNLISKINEDSKTNSFKNSKINVTENENNNINNNNNINVNNNNENNENNNENNINNIENNDNKILNTDINEINNNNNENNNNENNLTNTNNTNTNNNNNNNNINNEINTNCFPKTSFLPFTTKSYDSLFKEMINQKIDSLRLISPKHKQEIFSRNSNYESRSNFDNRYQNFYDDYY
jgi:hypothetical protein